MKTISLLLGLGVCLVAASKDTVRTAESDHAKVTISTAPEKKVRPMAAPSIVAIRFRIENRGSADLVLSPEQLFLKQPSGQVRKCLSVSEATELIIAKSTGMVSSVNDVLVGPVAGRNATDRNMAQAKAHIAETALSFGPIPAGSFKEGLIYFEGTGQARKNFAGSISAPTLFPGELEIIW